MYMYIYPLTFPFTVTEFALVKNSKLDLNINVFICSSLICRKLKKH